MQLVIVNGCEGRSTVHVVNKLALYVNRVHCNICYVKVNLLVVVDIPGQKLISSNKAEQIPLIGNSNIQSKYKL